MPGRTDSTRRSMVSATIRPALRLRWISSGDLKMITGRAPSVLSVDLAQPLKRPLRHFLFRAGPVDLAQEPSLRIELEKRRGALVIDLQAPPHHIFGVVLALHEGPAAHVADARLPGGLELDIVGP